MKNLSKDAPRENNLAWLANGVLKINMPKEIKLNFRVSIKALIAAAQNHLGLRDLEGTTTTELQGIARCLLGTKIEGNSVVELSIHGYAREQGAMITLVGEAADVAQYARAFQELLD